MDILKGLKKEKKVTMMVSNSKGQGAFVDYLVGRDSAYVKDGKFHLVGSVPEGTRRYVDGV